MTDKEKIEQLILTNDEANIILAFQPVKSQGISSLDLRDANLTGADLFCHDLSSDIFKDAINIEKHCYLLCLPIHKQLNQLYTHNYWVIYPSQQTH